jgi:hypothetical protein
VRKAVPRAVVAGLVMLMVSSPLITALSWRAGRLTYGDTARANYALLVSSKGEPTRPVLLNDSPKVWLYRWDLSCTRPAGFDLAYWSTGLEPNFSVRLEGKHFARNVLKIFDYVPWLATVIAAFLTCCWVGLVRLGGLSPPSVTVALGLPALAGLALFALIHIEPRYLAPFIVMGVLAMATSLRVPSRKPGLRSAIVTGSSVLVAALAGLLIHTMIDQSRRSLVSTESKPSYRAVFEEAVAEGRFLTAIGLEPGEEVASVGVADMTSVHAARMAGVRVTAELPDRDLFLHGTPDERARVIEAARKAGLKAMLSEAFVGEELIAEGWRHVPGTRRCSVLLLKQ